MVGLISCIRSLLLLFKKMRLRKLPKNKICGVGGAPTVSQRDESNANNGDSNNRLL